MDARLNLKYIVKNSGMPKSNRMLKNACLLTGIIVFLIVGIYLYIKNKYLNNVINISDAHVINMDKSKDRLVEIQEAARRVGMSLIRWPAINGRSMSENDIKKYNIGKNILKKTVDKKQLGVIGCFLSHQTLLKHLETLPAEPNNAHLIFEDDANIPVDFWQQWGEFSASVPANWDIIQLGVTTPNLKTLNGGRVHVASKQYGNMGAFAYLVKHSSLPKINDHLKTMNNPIDVMIQEKQKEWKIYFALPEICIHNDHGKSTIVIS